MISLAGTLAAPFPYFGGKALACSEVWRAFGDVDNYVEPFAGSAAMLLGAPDGKRIETINDADGFIVNFWRAVAADPDFYDAKIAGWWCWGACNWIGSGWCEGKGPHQTNGAAIFDSRKLPPLSAGQGINRQLPHLSAGRGINRQLPHLSAGRGEHPRTAFIREWMHKLATRLRDVRVTCGDWQRTVKDSVTVRHGLTGIFLDPPYTKGAMDYAAGGVGGELASAVRQWCAENGHHESLRIVLCGHAGEHDALLEHGWHIRTWTARKGYALTDDAIENSASETLWCSPACVGVARRQELLFEVAA